MQPVTKRIFIELKNEVEVLMMVEMILQLEFIADKMLCIHHKIFDWKSTKCFWMSRKL